MVAECGDAALACNVFGVGPRELREDLPRVGQRAPSEDRHDIDAPDAAGNGRGGDQVRQQALVDAPDSVLHQGVEGAQLGQGGLVQQHRPEAGGLQVEIYRQHPQSPRGQVGCRYRECRRPAHPALEAGEDQPGRRRRRAGGRSQPIRADHAPINEPNAVRSDRYAQRGRVLQHARRSEVIRPCYDPVGSSIGTKPTAQLRVQSVQDIRVQHAAGKKGKPPRGIAQRRAAADGIRTERLRDHLAKDRQAVVEL